MPVTGYNAAVGYNSALPWDGLAPVVPPTLPPLRPPTCRHWLRVAFNSNATDTTYIWTDLSSYLREDQGVPLATRRGRQDTTQKFSVGKGTYVLDNRKLHFESLNPASPFYGKLLPTKPVQSGEEYPWLPGIMVDGAFRDPLTYKTWTVVGGTLSAVAPTHDLGLPGIRVAAASTGSSWNLLGPATPIRADKPNGPMTASIRVNNPTAFTNTVTLSLRFYSDLAGTAFISQATSAAVAVNPATPEQRVAVTAAAIPGTALSARMDVSQNIPGNVTAGDQWTFRAAVMDYTAISFFQPAYTGFSDSWVCTDEIGDSTCVLTSSDTEKNLSLTPMNSPFYGRYLRSLNPTVWYRFGESGPQSSVSTMAFHDEMGGPSIHCNTGNSVPVHLSPWGFPYDTSFFFFNNGPLPGVAGHSPIDPDLAFSFVGPSSNDRGSLVLGSNCKPTGQNWSYAFSFRCTSGSWHNNDDLVATGGLFSFWTLLGINAVQLGTFPNQPHPSPGSAFLSVTVAPNAINPATGAGLGVNTDGGQLVIYAGIDGVAGAGTTTHQNIVIDELSHRIWITYEYSTDTVRVYVDGILDNSFHPMGGGSGINWTSSSNFNQLGDVDMIGKDGDPGHFEIDEFMFFNGTTVPAATITTDYDKFRRAFPIQRSTERVSGVFDLINLPAQLRGVDTTKGVSLIAVEAPFFQANPLTYLQLVEDTELGMLFCDRDGKVTFLAHSDIISGVYVTPQYTFGNGPGELSYEKVITTNDDVLFYTQGIASRQGGSPKIVNASSAANFFTRSISKTNLLFDSDDKATAVATQLATLYSKLGTKIKEMTVYPEASEALLVACSRIELGWMLALKMRPTGVLLPTVNVQVQGINQDVYRGKRRITYSLSNIFYTT